MRIRKQVRKPAFDPYLWLGVLIVTLVFCVLGAISMNTGRWPSMHHWLWGMSLAAFWGGAFFRLHRYGKRAYSWRQWLLLLGWTLIVLSDIAPAFAKAAPSAEVVGQTMVGVALLSIFFGVRKPRSGGVEPRDGVVRDE